MGIVVYRWGKWSENKDECNKSTQILPKILFLFLLEILRAGRNGYINDTQSIIINYEISFLKTLRNFIGSFKKKLYCQNCAQTEETLFKIAGQNFL